MVRVVWKNHGIEEATWETEEKMKREYPKYLMMQVNEFCGQNS